MSSKYRLKGRSGYELRKTDSGVRRWQKTGREIQTKTDTPPGFSSSVYAQNKTPASVSRVFPGIKQYSIKMNLDELMLAKHPDVLYDPAKRLYLPKMKDAKAAMDEFYHGTVYQFDRFAGKASERPKVTGHWNNGLGVHFADDHDVARRFSEGVYNNAKSQDGFERIPGRIITTTLDVKSPLITSSEAELNALFMAHVMATDAKEMNPAKFTLSVFNPMQYLGSPTPVDPIGLQIQANKHINSNYRDTMAGLSTEMLQDLRNTLKEGRLNPMDVNPEAYFRDKYGSQMVMLPDGKKASKRYIEMIRSAESFKSFLRKLGFDGVVYRNDMEGGIGVTPFDNSQIGYVEHLSMSNNKDSSLFEVKGRPSISTLLKRDAGPEWIESADNPKRIFDSAYGEFMADDESLDKLSEASEGRRRYSDDYHELNRQIEDINSSLEDYYDRTLRDIVARNRHRDNKQVFKLPANEEDFKLTKRLKRDLNILNSDSLEGGAIEQFVGAIKRARENGKK